MNPENNLGPCEQFTVLESRQTGNPSPCEVCDHPEVAHANAGRRTLSGGQIEELRRRIIVERFEKLQDERGRDEGMVLPAMSTNGDPQVHDDGT